MLTDSKIHHGSDGDGSGTSLVGRKCLGDDKVMLAVRLVETLKVMEVESLCSQKIHGMMS